MSLRGPVASPLTRAALTLALVSCNALWGLDELDFREVPRAGGGSGGAPAELCDPGYADCDDEPATACDTDTKTDVDHCGACQEACKLEHASSATCVDGHCDFQCASGYEDCDGLADSGCESDLSSDPLHCGACDMPCPTGVNAAAGGVPCESGACAYPLSCKAIHSAFPLAPSAVYGLDADGAGPALPFDAFCEMSADGGGWTLALKCDGALLTFRLAAELWTNEETFNPDAPAFDLVEAKLTSFLVMPFDALRLVMRDPDDKQERSMVLTTSGTSLRDSFGKETTTTAPKTDGWLGLLNQPSYQPNCNRQGFNRLLGNAPMYPVARLGIAMNDQDHCVTCDSWIGFGLNVGANRTQASCGNFGNGNPGTVTNGNQNKKAFGYILLR